MSGKGRQAARCVRSGLTLIELLGAIALLGLVGLLLVPRLTPVSSQAPASAQAQEEQCLTGMGLPSHGEPICEGWWIHRSPAEYVGIGMAIDTRLTEDGYVRIARPFPNSPAEEAGLEPGDVIQGVDGDSVQDQGTDRLIWMITDGQPGTPVTLTIARSGLPQPFRVTITRQRILRWSQPGQAGK